MSNFKFIVLTENGTVYDSLANKVIVTTTNGEITVLKGHIPLIVTVKSGRLVIFDESGEHKYKASNGVLKIGKDKTTLMSNKVSKI